MSCLSEIILIIDANIKQKIPNPTAIMYQTKAYCLLPTLPAKKNAPQKHTKQKTINTTLAIVVKHPKIPPHDSKAVSNTIPCCPIENLTASVFPQNLPLSSDSTSFALVYQSDIFPPSVSASPSLHASNRMIEIEGDYLFHRIFYVVYVSATLR